MEKQSTPITVTTEQSQTVQSEWTQIEASRVLKLFQLLIEIDKSNVKEAGHQSNRDSTSTTK